MATETGLRITCLLSPSCASETDLPSNLRAALDLERMEAEITVIRIEPAQAMALGLSASPTILIGDRELLPSPPSDAFG